MRSVIFANFTAAETARLGATYEVEQSNYCFFRDTCLHIWDCGGQESFVNVYLHSSVKTVFSNVKELVFVFDASGSDFDLELAYFGHVLDRLGEHSSNASVFCLLHKIDLIPKEQRSQVVNSLTVEIERSFRDHNGATSGAELKFFITSIWDGSLYLAWSAIVSDLVPQRQEQLAGFRELVDNSAYFQGLMEIGIFDESTMLLVSHCFIHPKGLLISRENRCEAISNILKRLTFLIRTHKIGTLEKLTWSTNTLTSVLIPSFYDRSEASRYRYVVLFSFEGNSPSDRLLSRQVMSDIYTKIKALVQ